MCVRVRVRARCVEVESVVCVLTSRVDTASAVAAESVRAVD